MQLIYKYINNNTLALQLFQLFRAGSLFLLSPIIAYLIDDKIIIGYFEEALLIGSAATFFWVSGIINPYLPYYHTIKDNSKLPFQVFLLLNFLGVTTCILLMLLNNLVFKNPYLGYFIIYIFFNAVSFINEYNLRLLEKPKTLISYGVISSLIFILSFGLVVYLTNNIVYGTIAIGLASLLKYLYGLGLLLNNFSKTIDFKLLNKFLIQSLPYFFVILLGGAFQYIDSLFINYYFTKEEFAIFRFGARELPFVMLLANAMSNSLSIDLSKNHQEQNLAKGIEKLKQSTKKLNNILFPLTILLLLASDYLFKILYNNQFNSSVPIFDLFLLLITLRLFFPQTILLSLKKNTLLLKITTLELGLNILLNIIFIPIFGVTGVVYSTLIAFLIEKTLLVFACNKLGYTLNTYHPTKQWFLWSLCLISIYLIKVFI